MLSGVLLESFLFDVKGNDSVNKAAVDMQKENSAHQRFLYLSFISHENSVNNVLALNGS